MFFSKLAVLFVGVVASVHADSIASEKRAIRPNPSNGHWVDAWASMPQLTEPANLPPAPFVRSELHLHLLKLTNFDHRTKPGRSS
jgi:hypothetical protein